MDAKADKSLTSMPRSRFMSDKSERKGSALNCCCPSSDRFESAEKSLDRDRSAPPSC